MATTRQALLNANNPQRADSSTSELNSLVNGGVVESAIVLSNVQGDSKGLGYPEVMGKLALGSAAFGANAAVFGWLLTANDGTNYETFASGTSTTTPPMARDPDFIWPIENVTQAAIKSVFAARGAIICATQKMLFWNMTGVTLAASGNSCNLYYLTDEFN